MNERIRSWTMAVTAVGGLLSASGCAVGVRYQRRAVPASPAVRESLPAGWTDAQPGDGVPRGKWWEVYQDSGLDALEDHVSISNQNVLAAEAQFRAARAAVSVTRGGLYPSVTTTPSAAVSGTGAA